MNEKLIFPLIIGLLVISKANNTMAQEETTENQRIAQFTFAYPLSTNGIESTEFSNNFSLNTLYGVNGGVNGAEIGGIMNINTGPVNGFQISGVINLNLDETRAFQLATVNLALATFKGFQLGVVNYSKRLEGVQFGVVNIVEDGEKAMPIGLVNIVKNGYYTLDISANEVFPVNLTYKMGVERFYTLLKLSRSTFNNNPVYCAGFGLGSNIHLKDKHYLMVDLSTNQVAYPEYWDWKGTNAISKAELSYKVRLNNHISIFAGPSFNVYYSSVMVNNEYGTLNAPSNLFKRETANRNTSGWIGLNGGISISL